MYTGQKLMLFLFEFLKLIFGKDSKNTQNTNQVDELFMR